jgi:hypothetical protein
MSSLNAPSFLDNRTLAAGGGSGGSLSFAGIGTRAIERVVGNNSSTAVRMALPQFNCGP